MPSRAVVLALLLALAALAGCGSGGSDVADQSASQVLRSTFGPDRQISSGRMDAQLRVTGLQASQQPITLGVTGPFAGSGSGSEPRFDLDLSLAARGVGLNGGVISTGKAGFVTLGQQAYALDAATYASFRKAYADEGTSKQSTTTLGKLGVDPLRWLRDPRRVGEEQVAGVKAVHVTSSVDVAALLADVVKLLDRANAAGVDRAAGQAVQLTAAQREAVQRSVRSSSLDVWTGEDDGLLRRVAVKVDYDVPAAQRESSGGLTQGTIDLGLTLADLNAKQTIRTPSGARPLSELSSAISQLSGATG